MSAASSTVEDFAQRIGRAAGQAAEAGLAGVLVTPGPDLRYFTGYSPIVITERITMLAINAARDPAMIVPIIERPDAESAPGSPALSLNDWTDGDDPYALTARLLDERGRYAISDSAWAMHVLGLTTHEPPYVIEGETHLLQPGMCFSIEPGIYLPDRFGVRIEDIVTVTEDGGRRLNNTSHEMRIVT